MLLVGVLHKTTLRRLISGFESILTRPLMAKFKDLELRVDDAVTRLGEVARLADVTTMALQGLSPNAVGLLIGLVADGSGSVAPSLHGQLRELRDRGLIEHDGERLAESAEVRPTTLGKQVAASIERIQPATPGS
jgi:hypothetical protein